MPTIWIASSIALWGLVLIETALLLLVLRTIGRLRQQGAFERYRPPEEWGVPLGKPAPLFSLQDQNGHVVRLEDFRGKRLVLVFIAPGCSYCPAVIESLSTMRQNNPDLGVLLLGGLDGESNRAYAAEHHAQMPILTITRGLDREAYGIDGVPFAFVLDEEGVVRAKGLVVQSDLLTELLNAAFASVVSH